MGFRFRKSFKVMPGIRFNLSARGASMSLGRRGATLNLSKRGASATFGIPGTGLSYTTSTGGTRRRSAAGGQTSRRSTQQLAAEQRRLAQEARFEDALEDVARIEGELVETLDAWRELPELPSATDLQGELVPRPRPDNDNAAPDTLDLAAAEKTFRIELAARIDKQAPRSFASRWLWLPFGLVSGALISVYTSLWLLPVALFFFTALSKGLAEGIRNERLRPHTDAAFAHEWPQTRKQLILEQEARVAEHDASVAQAEGRWLALENERISLLRRVLAGDGGAVEAAITAAVEWLDFPFETECAVGVDEAGGVVIDIDLPEIEDVIPESRLRVLKGGTVKEVKRKALERNELYGTLVTGLAYTVAATALAIAPGLDMVTVAGHTQRKTRGSFVASDAYVFEVRFARGAFAGLDVASFNPLTEIQKLPSRIDIAANGGLKKIAAPDWAEELWDAD
jgi:hypothetical protein